MYQLTSRAPALAKKLLQDLNKKRVGLEYRTCTFKKVKNLSCSDLDMVEIFAEEIQSGNNPFDGRYIIFQEIEKVFVNAKIVEA